jgi:hypothetical protein
MLVLAGAGAVAAPDRAGAAAPVRWTATAGEAAVAYPTTVPGRPDGAVLTVLTWPARTLPGPVDRVDAAAAGVRPAGTDAEIGVRARTPAGWTEWQPPGPLPAPSRTVEVRLSLTAAGGTGSRPAASAVLVTAYPAAAGLAARPLRARTPQVGRVFATRIALVGETTANGHVITEHDHFVALPSRRGLSVRDGDDYRVKVCNPDNGRCVVAPVWDVGPWNTRDDYWNPPSVRQNWADLPQGMPEAQAARQSGYNGGRDQFGRTVRNPAGIDLADGTFWDDLGMDDNGWVTVTYLWTDQAT